MKAKIRKRMKSKIRRKSMIVHAAETGTALS
jgi:hypothetical protein